ncbi:hypothetical protein Tco_0335752 [Tanacetum coccineum]
MDINSYGEWRSWIDNVKLPKKNKSMFQASGEKTFIPVTVSVCGTCVAKGVTTNDDKEEKVGCSDGTSCTDGFVIDNKAMPPAASSSSCEEVFKGDKGVSMNRKRRNVVPDLNSEPTLLRSRRAKDRLEGGDQLGSAEKPRLDPNCSLAEPTGVDD